MADPRFFAKLDVGYFDNPKVADFIEDQPRVLLLHLRAVVYCRQHLTDGRFPIRTVVRLTCASYCGSQCEGQCDFCATVDAGLFVRIDSRTAEVHDYLKHQDSAEQVTKRRSAGQAAAAARWGKSADAKGNADRNAKGNAKGNAEERRGEERRERASTRRKPSRPLPSDWSPNDNHAAYADEHNIDLQAQASKFRGDAEAKDKRYVDWDAAFRNWLVKALEFGQTRRQSTDPWANVPVINARRGA